ncbi:hypothetical protein HJ588_03385 [Flexivirga sp. ID2601S]|uniref:ATPase BadF/BadG/BcrA/BcrD type domain-containing protein n=1 Tax=Flexivirga aerilata TaxID=1656889 RepID=A0A849AEI0_9MICO|nr:hypothetical protein [Flexivirga aerilata]NNG38317.1 hypothetical protein [Flexivirga aerilata]
MIRVLAVEVAPMASIGRSFQVPRARPGPHELHPAPGTHDLDGGGATSYVAASRVVSDVLHHRDAGHSDVLAVAARSPLEPERTAQQLAEVALDRAEVVVAASAVAAHAGALAGRPGALLVAGAGAIGVGVDADGGLKLRDGRGPATGDLGSAHWMGRQGLLLAMTHGGALADAAQARFGEEWEGLATEEGPEVTAQRVDFASDIAAAAAAGSGEAYHVVRSAAALLGRTLADASVTLDLAEVPCAIRGRLTSLGPTFVRQILSAATSLDPRLRLVDPEGDTLAGAARLAIDRSTPHEAHVVRLPDRAAS